VGLPLLSRVVNEEEITSTAAQLVVSRYPLYREEGNCLGSQICVNDLVGVASFKTSTTARVFWVIHVVVGPTSTRRSVPVPTGADLVSPEGTLSVGLCVVMNEVA